MAQTFSIILTMDQLPHYNTLVEANIQLLNSPKLELQSQLEISHRKDLNYLAQPIVQRIKAIKSTLEKQCNNYRSWKSYLAIALVVFFVSAALHLGITYTLQRCKNLHNFLLFSHKLDSQQIQLKLIMMLEDQHPEGLQTDENFQ